MNIKTNEYKIWISRTDDTVQAAISCNAIVNDYFINVYLSGRVLSGPAGF